MHFTNVEKRFQQNRRLHFRPLMPVEISLFFLRKLRNTPARKTCMRTLNTRMSADTNMHVTCRCNLTA